VTRPRRGVRRPKRSPSLPPALAACMTASSGGALDTTLAISLLGREPHWLFHPVVRTHLLALKKRADVQPDETDPVAHASRFVAEGELRDLVHAWAAAMSPPPSSGPSVSGPERALRALMKRDRPRIRARLRESRLTKASSEEQVIRTLQNVWHSFKALHRLKGETPYPEPSQATIRQWIDDVGKAVQADRGLPEHYADCLLGYRFHVAPSEVRSRTQHGR
jgi:hypothetical protein